MSHRHGPTGSDQNFATTSSRVHYERSRPFAVKHLALVWDLDMKRRRIVGVAELTIVRIDETAKRIDLDAIAFDIKTVTIGGKPAPFDYDGRVLSVAVRAKGRAPQTLRIEYEATPQRGMYFLAPDTGYPKRPLQVWTQFQDEDARYVLPCMDEPHTKMTTSLRVKVPTGFVVLSNGELTKSRTMGAKTEFTWEMREPHPAYLLTLVAGEFAVLTEEESGVPLSYYVPKGREKDAKATFANTGKMLAFFSKRFGIAYPWNKYAQVVVSDFTFGGMENTTATTLYEHVILDARARIDLTSDDLIAHELAHQWFGDLVTCRDWSEGWLNEGFATFSEHLWRLHHLGKDEYEHGLQVDVDAYLDESRGRYKRPVVHKVYDAPVDLFDRHLYEKGGLFLHSLSVALGEGPFWKGIHAYLETHKKGVVETVDLQRALERASGRSLDRAFAQAIFQAGHPEVEVSLAFSDGVLRVDCRQTQTTVGNASATNPTHDAFQLDLALDIHTGNAVLRHVVTLSQRSETFQVPLTSPPRFVVVDPELAIVGSVSTIAPERWLHKQLSEGKSSRARFLAARALSKSGDATTIAALSRSLGNEKEFWSVRAECARTLAHFASLEAREVLLASVSVKHPKVRRAVMNGLGGYRDADVARALAKVASADESYLVTAEALRALGRTKQVEIASKTLEKALASSSWADVVAAAATDGLGSLRDEAASRRIEALTKYGTPPRVRARAVAALAASRPDKRTREILADCMRDRDPMFRTNVAHALADLDDGASRSVLGEALSRETDPRAQRALREGLRGAEAGRKGIAELKDIVETLRAEVLSLRARVSAFDEGGKKVSRSSKRKIS
ncbi:MAG: M1 family metallopeptidase [Polyangiaceae bacterium]